MENTSASSVTIENKCTVLVVEDDELFRKALILEFRLRRFQALGCASGHEALEFLSTTSVDVVISDIQMPGGTGLELLTELRLRNLSVPIVLLMTGFAEVSSEQAKSGGAEALFSKPFDRDHLVNTVVRIAAGKYSKPISSHTLENCDVKMKINFPGLDKQTEGIAVRMSQSDAFIPWSENFPELADSVSFDIEFPSGETCIGGVGTVKWISFKTLTDSPAGFSIEFNNPNMISYPIEKSNCRT